MDENISELESKIINKTFKLADINEKESILKKKIDDKFNKNNVDDPQIKEKLINEMLDRKELISKKYAEIKIKLRKEIDTLNDVIFKSLTDIDN